MFSLLDTQHYEHKNKTLMCIAIFEINIQDSITYLLLLYCNNNLNLQILSLESKHHKCSASNGSQTPQAIGEA